MSVANWSKEKHVEPIGEDEYEEIQAQFDNFLVGGTHSDAHVHLYECRQLKRSISENIREKPTVTIPYGYWDVCEFCTYKWRDGVSEETAKFACPQCDGHLYRGTYYNDHIYRCGGSDDCELSGKPIGRTKRQVRIAYRMMNGDVDE